MKRTLILLLAAAAVFAVVKKVKDAREERELWQEALAAGKPSEKPSA